MDEDDRMPFVGDVMLCSQLFGEVMAASRLLGSVARRWSAQWTRGSPSSFFPWLPLPDDVRADQVASALLREKISLSTAEPFATTKDGPHALRLALGSVDITAFRDALQKIARAIDDHTYR